MITPRYFIIYKPFGMLSQFSKEGDHKTLANLNYSFPKDVYPVGRLDADSEGLLFLTNNKQINNLLLDPKHKHSRTYLIQVEGVISNEAKSKLEKGVSITVDGKEYKTLPSKANLIPSPEENGQIDPRNPPIRFRKNIPTTWIELELQEGKNRQIRKMTAAVGFPTLRLIRVSIEKIKIDKMKPGEVKEIKKEEINFLLNF
jgi:23S rRNA pseudouridine2457 synthase